MTDAPDSFDGQPELHKVTAALRFDTDDIADWLSDYFGVNAPEGSYSYNLTRCKSSYGLGTMSLDDYEPFTEETVKELAQFLTMKLREW
jgi:hypothetical protein